MNTTRTSTTTADRTRTRSVRASMLAGDARVDERFLGMEEQAGSTPATSSKAREAHLVVHPHRKRAAAGSNPVSGSVAGVAQLVEQLICNHQVVGSNPTVSSKS